MIYLVIIVLVAAAGIARLWLLQRRQRQNLSTVDAFWDGLEKISTPTAGWNGLDPEDAAPTSRPVSGGPLESAPISGGPLESAPRRPARRSSRELDPDRRAAAKARLQARRRSSRGAV